LTDHYKQILLESLRKEELQNILKKLADLSNCDVRVISFSGDTIVASAAQNDFFQNAVAQDIFLYDEPIATVQLKPRNRHSATMVKITLSLFTSLLTKSLNDEYEMTALVEELLAKYEEVNLLFDLSESLGAEFNLKHVYDILLEKVVQALDVERVSVLIYDEKKKTLRLIAAVGLETQFYQSEVPIEKSISGYVLQRGEPLLIEDLNQLPPGLQALESGKYKTSSFISVPLICSPIKVKDKRIGVINVTDKRNGKSFTTGDLKLLNSIASMAAISIYNNRLLEQVRDSERVKRELEIAESIQMGMLPSSPPRVKGIDVWGKCRSAKNVGGDYFDFFVTDDTHLGIVVADVSGHNVGAALMMAITRSALRSAILEQKTVEDIFRSTNRLLFSDLTNAGLFITMFLAYYSSADHMLTYGNAGHPPALLLRPKGQKLYWLDAEGLIIGLEKEIDFQVERRQLQKGDILVFYTDGIIEAVNTANEQFGTKSLIQVVKKMYRYSAQQIGEAILNVVDEFVGTQALRDDVTLVVAKIME